MPTSARMANKAKAALQLILAVLYLLKLEGIHCTGCDQQVPAVTALGLKWLRSSTPASSLTFLGCIWASQRHRKQTVKLSVLIRGSRKKRISTVHWSKLPREFIEQ